MALKGNLRDFSFIQLLNLIHLARKTGTLVLENTDERVLLSFWDGRLAYAQHNREDNGLISVLHRARKLTANQSRLLKERAGKMSDQELGLLLINASYISQQEILISLQTYFIGVLNRLFTWAEGLFRFENDLLPPEGKIRVRAGLENIILEGSRRQREKELLLDEIPNLDIALKFAERTGSNPGKYKLNPKEWKVVSLIHPKNSIRQIARAANLDDMEIRRIVYGLLHAGIVQLTRQEGIVRFLAAKPSAGNQLQKPAEQKSLIGRLVMRIRAL